MSLTAGDRLGTYEILAPIGAGGMGEVYRARDVKLKRDVAVKVLPDLFSTDPEKLARFEREAVLLASLNHPNVATLHGFEEWDGKRLLVMEYVDGVTLAERMAGRAIPLNEAIPLFLQIAEGLEAAHAKGIIHRDLKPGNVKLTASGVVKVLDFGLAKALAPETATSSVTESPTVTRGTEAGVILGTAAYMSPEQARGEVLDERTDVWSLGVCLYEALSGRAAFAGPTVSDTIAAILEREPNWEVLPRSMPPGVHVVLRRMLRKDRRARVHSVADARIWIEESMATPVATASGGGRTRSGVLVAAALAAVVSALVTWLVTGLGSEAPKAVNRLVVSLPEGAALAQNRLQPSIALSPDGRSLAYIGAGDGGQQLFLRRLDDLEPRPIDQSEGASTAFFSPDGEWLGFHADGNLMKVAVSGGGPVLITETTVEGGESGFMWSDDGEIVFAPFHNTGLRRVSADGGEHEVVSAPDRERAHKSHRQPRPLPRNDFVLVTLVTADIASADDASVALLSLETGEYRVLIEGGSSAQYNRSGHLVYARNGTLFAVPFDADGLRVTGSPVPVADGVAMNRTHGSAEFSLSDDGSLLYAPGTPWDRDYRLVIVDRDGRSEPLIETVGAWGNPVISPDGDRLLVRNNQTNSSLWMYDFERRTLTRVVHRWDNGFSSWSPDGRQMVFGSSRAGGAYNLFIQAVDGSGEPRPLTEGERSAGFPDWSPAEDVLVFDDFGPGTGLDLWWLSLQADSIPTLFLETEFDETFPAFSPNGRWVAYQSNETGRFEVYVRPFPPAPGLWPVSADGGTAPVWNANGKELFYRNGDALMVVAVETEGPELVLGEPARLFEKRASTQFDVFPDGERFVMVEEPETSSAPTALVLVQNFDEELKRLVPEP